MTLERFLKQFEKIPYSSIHDEIKILCPNGELVDPNLKVIREKEFDYSSKITGFVLDWRE